MKRELDAVVIQMHSAGVSYNEAVRHFKRRYLLEVLTRHKGNQCKAAEELGMHRNTLSRTLSELEMTRAQIRSGMRRPPSSERPQPVERQIRVGERPRPFGNAIGAGGADQDRPRIQPVANHPAGITRPLR